MTLKNSASDNAKYPLKPNYIPLGIPGLPTLKNRGAIDWSSNGLVAIGTSNEVLIIDSEELRPILTLPPEHKSAVHKILWNPSSRPFHLDKKEKRYSDLISVDTSSTLIIWDISSRKPLAHFTHPEGRVLLSLQWAPRADEWLTTKLFLLYTSSLFLVLDISTLTYQNILIATPSPNELLDFDCDPHGLKGVSVGFVGEGALYMLTEWDPLRSKQEKIDIKRTIQYRTKSNSASPLLTEPNKRNSSTTSGIRKLVTDIIVGETLPSLLSPNNENLKVKFHPSLSNHVIVSTVKEIFLINTQFDIVLHSFSLDKTMSNITQIILPHRAPALFILYENGVLNVKKYTISGIHSPEVVLENIAMSDPPRLSSKKSEVLGFSTKDWTENEMILYVNDGRFIKYEIVAKEEIVSQNVSKKHLVTPMTTSAEIANEGSGNENIRTSAKWKSGDLGSILGSILKSERGENIRLKLKKATVSTGSLTCIKSVPSSDLIFCGSTTGFLLQFEVFEDEKIKGIRLLKRFSVHSNTPVTGVEVVSSIEILTYANLSLSANPKCEMAVTDVLSGVTNVLKQDEAHHISVAKVSPSGQYLIIVFKNGVAPCELWDLPRRQLIKTLPTKLPPITCVTWKDPSAENKDSREETFFLTDLGSFLFTFRVDGSRFSSATCVKLDTTGLNNGIPVGLFSSKNLVYRGDSAGMLVMYDTEKKTASNGVYMGSAPMYRLMAGGDEFKHLMVAQFSEFIEIWHILDVEKQKEAKNLKILDFCFLNGYFAIIPKSTGGIKFLSFTNDIHPTVSTDCLHHYNSFLTPSSKCKKLLQVLETDFSLHDLCLLFQELNSFEEANFIRIVANSLEGTAKNNIKRGNERLDIFSDNKFYKEVLVKLAQCVWLLDKSKRDKVANLLIYAGETEKSAEILLDTDPSESSYISNGMRAALCISPSTLPESSKAVLKIVSTNLVASGNLEDGLQLLCLLSKYSEAAKYIESGGNWAQAVLMAKTSLQPREAGHILGKYAHFLNSARQVLQSAALYASTKQFDKGIDALFSGRKRHLCYLLLLICKKWKVDLSGLSDGVKLAIRLDFARFIFECELVEESTRFCEEIGEEAKDLKSEIQILGGN